MCCNNMWCYTDMSHCEWAVCGYEGFFGVVFIVLCRYSSVCNQIKVLLQHIPTQGYNITQSSVPDDGHMVARNMLSEF